ncbi:L-lactate dehydrogenase [Verticillium alfalfae VaMs.102]|uniref:L-lactate dehydrogenase n=1 Tax=Verticillium alfalfae (strain VaMs.102 / ATCC MYA-4576 / FGSC 10136) TaxID=526221 RepID=C9SE80_VERA1|nr:L-lactate dehydrogenase [Verticillium alfalfae VaMs.102]EEY16489.1 L-lactate dehydrogenase [Verticillium alfalfae VaMs.102]
MTVIDEYITILKKRANSACFLPCNRIPCSQTPSLINPHTRPVKAPCQNQMFPHIKHPRGKCPCPIPVSILNPILPVLDSREPTTSDADKLEQLAKEKLTENGWFNASSNAGLSHTHLANRQAFFRHKILPCQLDDTNDRWTRTTLFGQDVSALFDIAPVGINKFYRPRGELPVALVAAELGLSSTLSTTGSCSMEDVASAYDVDRAAACTAGAANVRVLEAARFFQLYMPHDDELTLSWRHDDAATFNYAFDRGIGADLGLPDPVFQVRLQGKGIDPAKQPKEAAVMWIDRIWHGCAWSWDKAVWARETWREISGGKSFLIKGIQQVDDAESTADLGVAADIVKALALGANVVLVGRLWIWGLSIVGESGIRHVLVGLVADLDLLMNVAVINSIGDITQDSTESPPPSCASLNEKSKL